MKGVVKVKNSGNVVTKVEKSLFADLRELIRVARNRVAVSVNSEAIMMYWQVGLRIRKDLLKSKRATYGEELVRKASDYLVGQYGLGWGIQTVRHCVRAAYTIELDALAFAHGG